MFGQRDCRRKTGGSLPCITEESNNEQKRKAVERDLNGFLFCMKNGKIFC